eukprot:2205087-Amphidinium_carterae.1
MPKETSACRRLGMLSKVTPPQGHWTPIGHFPHRATQKLSDCAHLAVSSAALCKILCMLAAARKAMMNIATPGMYSALLTYLVWSE